MKAVRFPMYFEVCGYQTITFPDEIDANDENAVKGYISDNWQNIELPEEYDYIGDNGFDFESSIQVFDRPTDKI